MFEELTNNATSKPCIISGNSNNTNIIKILYYNF